MNHAGPIRRVLELFGIPLLLVLVAVRQIALSQKYSLSPWKGGGFGMFSSLDRAETRLVRCDLVNDSSRTPIPLPRTEPIERLVSDAQSVPTADHLVSLIREIARDVPVPTTGGKPEVHVEVRKLRYRSKDHRLSAELLADVDRSAH
jgi:hypothetical protein